MEKRWHLVIADDRQEFPSFCWRFLTRAIGLSSPDSELPEEALSSPDGALTLHFVRLDDGKESQQQDLLDLILGLSREKESKVFAIIDVFAGKRHDAKQLAAALTKHGAEEAMLTPARRGGDFSFQLVSAYPFNPQEFGVTHIETKSLDFLERLRTRIVEPEIRHKNPEELKVRHILVSGAGFEMRNSAFEPGLDSTLEVMMAMPAPFARATSGQGESEQIVLQPRSGYHFPVPQIIANDHPLAIAAKEGNLDDYWDRLIKWHLEYLLKQEQGFEQAPNSSREERKRSLVLREMELRDAFRRAFLRLDWGFLDQALHAAKLGWHAWLTTNYTRFADRAVDAVDAVASKGSVKWRVLSSVSEARALSRTVLGVEARTGRRLFKLHGDLAHLQTMAIAGEDKDSYSRLPFPVDKLHWIYDAATQYLQATLSEARDFNGVAWHVVGHALWDSPLLDLMREVSKQIRRRGGKPTWQRFIIANRDPSGPEKRLKDIAERSEMQFYSGEAKTYMAHLLRRDLSYFESPLWKRSWKTKVF
ncbi:MAG: hypothetical protein WAM82_04845 [Thermoanaerobaculia bacterium]